MTYGIVLDHEKNSLGIENYAINFHGTLAQCRLQEIATPGVTAVSKSAYKSHFVEKKSLRDGNGQPFPGEILKFEIRGM
jgi:hypothetical protein